MVCSVLIAAFLEGFFNGRTIEGSLLNSFEIIPMSLLNGLFVFYPDLVF